MSLLLHDDGLRDAKICRIAKLAATISNRGKQRFRRCTATRDQTGRSATTMTDDFRRLVSQANPAASQYQPANNVSNAYPPSSSSSLAVQHMDPFFDDDDDNLNIPDSAFGRPEPMRSQGSVLPLTSSAAPPAGTGSSSLGDHAPQDWNFDDNDFQPAGGPTPHVGSIGRPKITARFRKWKWPWQKHKVPVGDRVIALTNSAANADFCSNSVSTSKYNLVTFVPKFFAGGGF